MNATPRPRHEKNRHHLATAVSVIFGIVCFLGFYSVSPHLIWGYLASAVLFGLILFGRTLRIESGIRRTPTPAAVEFEHRWRLRMARWFGFTTVEERPTDSDSRNEATRVREDA